MLFFKIAADKARRQAEANAAKGISAVTETSAVVREKQEETKKQAPTATNTRIQLRLPDGKRLVQVKYFIKLIYIHQNHFTKGKNLKSNIYDF